eukprot:CAMPEP_0174241238 /NCGR_PEP_ID=MMETSP0417-20130205/22349_1 /TAXON_ID=242541 /ORGANISM="Mayorella sp, Strain BSH-02190019" /LENGTH=325 /DNA_ID=CAMNT_0015320447 /DNA_START=1 /DNA_END=978 /DNA_ORIENTATION=+
MDFLYNYLYAPFFGKGGEHYDPGPSSALEQPDPDALKERNAATRALCPRCQPRHRGHVCTGSDSRNRSGTDSQCRCVCTCNSTMDEAQLPPLSDVGLMCRQQAVYRRQAARRALVSRYQRFDEFVRHTQREAERLAASTNHASTAPPAFSSIEPRDVCGPALLDEEMRDRRAEQTLVTDTLRRRPNASDRTSILLQRGWLDSALRERDHTQQTAEVAQWRAEHAAQFRAEFERMRAQRLQLPSVLHVIPHGWPVHLQEEQHRMLGEYVSRRRHQTERGLRADLDLLAAQVASMDDRMQQVHRNINQQPSPLPALEFDESMPYDPR